MDFPPFVVPFFGSRLLFALDAITHVLVSHGGAVGGSLLIAVTEWLAWKRGDEQLEEWARKMLFVFFVVTTALGAATGVGIWLNANVINPVAIGSLLRVFFWHWFTEWIVFVAEVTLILVYFFTWDKWRGPRKIWHIRLGFTYAVASWLTMSLITGILGFMLTPGAWLETRSMEQAFTNPTWLPSLVFRTPLAISLAAAWGLVYSHFLALDPEFRARLRSYLAKWMLAAGIVVPIAGLWYVSRVPAAVMALGYDALIRNGIMTFTTIMGQIMTPGVVRVLNAIGILAIVVPGLVALLRPRLYRHWMAVLTILAAILMIGEMEMVREFIRKPYVIYNYLLANGIRLEDRNLLNQEGVLAHSRWAAVDRVTPENRVQAGYEIFKLECRYCHTPEGLTGLAQRTRGWSEEAIDAYIQNLHQVRQFMPPFTGTDEERRAVAAWVFSLNQPPAADLGGVAQR